MISFNKQSRRFESLQHTPIKDEKTGADSFRCPPLRKADIILLLLNGLQSFP